MSLPPPLSIRVPGTAAGIQAATDAFDAFRTTASLADAAAWPVHVALDEVLANIVQHAYRGRSDGVIDLTFTLAEDRLTVAVADDGPEMNPLLAPEPDTIAPLGGRRIGGLGIHLVRHLMQAAEYSRQNGRNCLVLVRSLGAGAQAAPPKD
jgi:serine/threonine-protein kinase RsbW